MFSSKIVSRICGIQNFRFQSQANFARRVVQPTVVRIHRADPSADYYGQDSFNNHKQKFEKKRFDEGYVGEENLGDPTWKKQKKNDQQDVSIPQYRKWDDDRVQFSETMVKARVSKFQSNLMVLEGHRLINEALASPVKVTHIFFSAKEQLRNLENLLAAVQIQGTVLMKVPYREMKPFSALKTPPGLMAVVERNMEVGSKSAKTLPVTLICDQIRDPGNLGTMLRTAAGAGIDQILLTRGCVDVWNDKVLKSAAGAHFKIPIEPVSDWETLRGKLYADEFDVFVADSRSINADDHDNLPSSIYYEIDYFKESSSIKPTVLVMGNEARGTSSEAMEFARRHSGRRIRIPVYTDVESLNVGVASAVILFEMRRQFNFCQK